MRYVIGFISGFTASRLLYKITHSDDFPEVGRYAIGIIIIALAMKLSDTSTKEIEDFVLTALPVGAGVAIARIF